MVWTSVQYTVQNLLIYEGFFSLIGYWTHELTRKQISLLKYLQTEET